MALSDADRCRVNGWVPSTRLERVNESGIRERVEITAIGEDQVLGKRTHVDGTPLRRPFERLWTFRSGEWEVVTGP